MFYIGDFYHNKKKKITSWLLEWILIQTRQNWGNIGTTLLLLLVVLELDLMMFDLNDND